MVFTPQTGDLVTGSFTSEASGAPTVQVSLAGNIPAPTGGGGGTCAIVGTDVRLIEGAETFGLLLIAAGWFVFRRRKKEQEREQP